LSARCAINAMMRSRWSSFTFTHPPSARQISVDDETDSVTFIEIDFPTNENRL